MVVISAALSERMLQECHVGPLIEDRTVLLRMHLVPSPCVRGLLTWR